MAVTATNLVQGPGTLYTGDFGATQPQDSAITDPPDVANWTDAGGTDSGLSLSVNQKYSQLTVDQIVDMIESRMTERTITVATNLAEISLDNLALALNITGPASGTGYKSLDIAAANSSATKALYKSLIMDGWGPNMARRRVIIPKILSTAEVKFAYQKDGQTFYSVEFTAHWVDATTPIVHLVDADA